MLVVINLAGKKYDTRHHQDNNKFWPSRKWICQLIFVTKVQAVATINRPGFGNNLDVVFAKQAV